MCGCVSFYSRKGEENACRLFLFLYRRVDEFDIGFYASRRCETRSESFTPRCYIGAGVRIDFVFVSETTWFMRGLDISREFHGYKGCKLSRFL